MLTSLLACAIASAGAIFLSLILVVFEQLERGSAQTAVWMPFLIPLILAWLLKTWVILKLPLVFGLALPIPIVARAAIAALLFLAMLLIGPDIGLAGLFEGKARTPADYFVPLGTLIALGSYAGSVALMYMFEQGSRDRNG